MDTLVNTGFPVALFGMADDSARYQDGGVDLADVALVFAGDCQKDDHVLTVDRRHFDRYRTPAGKRLVRFWLED